MQYAKEYQVFNVLFHINSRFIISKLWQNKSLIGFIGRREILAKLKYSVNEKTRVLLKALKQENIKDLIKKTFGVVT